MLLPSDPPVSPYSISVTRFPLQVQLLQTFTLTPLRGAWLAFLWIIFPSWNWGAGSQPPNSLGLECVLVPRRVGPAQPAGVMPALPAGWCQGQSQPHGELAGPCPQRLPFTCRSVAEEAAGLPHRCKCFPAAVFSWVIFYRLFRKWLNFSSALFLALVRSLAVLQDKHVNVQSVHVNSNLASSPVQQQR